MKSTQIAIDIGNGYIKSTNLEGEKLHFPTISQLDNEISILKSDIDYTININGKSYFMGNLAALKKGVRRWEYNNNFNADTLLYVALCCHILAETDQIDLAIGLPYSCYLKDKGERLKKDLINKKIETIYKNTQRNIVIQDVSVYPQGIGAYFSNLYDIKGKPKKGAEEYIKSIYIDVGYRTVDVVAFKAFNDQFVLIQENSFSLEEQGMYKAINNIAKKGSEQFEMTEKDVEFAIQNNNSIFENMYGKLDIKPLEHEEYQRLAKQISHDINLRLSEDIKKYKHIFLTGGGAIRIYKYLQDIYPNLKLQKEHIFCNANGYLALKNTK